MRLTSKVISLMLVVLMMLSIAPTGVFAAVVMNETYNTMSDDGNNYGWVIENVPTHAEFEIKNNDGVCITQTQHTDDVSTMDGTFKKYFTGPLVKQDTTTGMSLYSNDLRGNVKITVDFVVDSKDESTYGAFYQLNIDGYLNIRVYNEKIMVFNADSATNSEMTMQTMESTYKKGFMGLGGTGGVAGDDKTVVINIDTVNDTVSVTHNDNTSTGKAFNSQNDIPAQGLVKSLYVKNMQRLGTNSYFKVTGIKVECDQQNSTLTTASQDILNSIPSAITSSYNNVTENITLPVIAPGTVWTTSNKDVMTGSGKISRTSQTDLTSVVLSAKFDLETTDGHKVGYVLNYPLTVNGVTTRTLNTTTINPTPNATSTTEKWYTMPTRGNEEDGYPMFDDPDYISDEAFFGKWNSSTSSWTSQPYFRYSDYPAMSKVESAAKAGNYETAKNELLAYYRTVASNRTTSVDSLSSSRIEYNEALYQLLSRNAYVTNFISNYVINMFSIPKSWSQVSIDVTNRLNEAKGSYNTFTTVLASVDKYRNQAEIYSRESSYAPKIVATVNGVEKTFNAVKDATLQGGKYENSNYGSATTLYVEEAGSWATPEDRTKRAFIGFDISGLKSSDKITNAKIVLQARHTGTDSEKLMAAYWLGESSWLEDKVCWDTFKDHMYFSCNDMYSWDYVTSNDVTIKGKVCGYHRDVEPAYLVTAYSYYAQHPELEPYYEKYAYTYLRQYMGLINSIGLDPNVMNQLDMSTHISGVTTDILRLMGSKYMTGEVLTAYLKHLWLLTDYHAYNCFGKTNNNWATYSTAAVYDMSARFPEFAKHDEWISETIEENDRVFGHFAFQDGMSYELSSNYTNTLLGTFSSFTTSQQTGEQLPYNESTTQVIYNNVKSLFNQSGPYLGGFNLGDAYDPYASYSSTFKTWYDNLFKDDPVISYLAGQDGELPKVATTNYPVGQRTFMRSDWSKNALALAMTNKMVGSHGHKDALSIAMFAYGKYLLTDQGYGGVQTGNTVYYMSGPQQHNIVTVNDSKNYLVDGTVADGVISEYNTINDVDGTQLNFDSNDHYDFVEYSTPAYQATSNSQRSVMFLKNQKFYIVTDYHVPTNTSATNEYAQNWHLYPGAKMTIDSSTKVIRSNFTDEPNVMLVPVDPDSISKTEIRGTWYSEKGGQIADSQKGMLYKSKTGNGVFSTVILPMNVGEDYSVTTTKLTNSLSDENINLFSFTVKNNKTNEQSNFYYYHLNDDSLRTTVSVGSYSTDANTLLVEEDTSGNIVSLYMVDGSFVKKGSTSIIKTADGKRASLSFDITSSVLDFHSSERDIKVLENTLINSSLATSVRFNMTNKVPYTVVDGNMTFIDLVETFEVEEILLTDLNFDGLTNNSAYSGGNADGGLYTARYNVTDNGSATAVHSGDRKYINSKEIRSGFNYWKTNTNLVDDYGYGSEGYDTLHVSYEINVPANDTARVREFYLQHGGQNNTTYIRSPLSVHAVDGKFFVTSANNTHSGYTTYNPYIPEYSVTADVKAGQWQKVDIYLKEVASGKRIDATVAVDGVVIYKGIGTENIKFMSIGAAYFFGDGNVATGYDNIRFALDDSADIPTYENAQGVTPEVVVVETDFEGLTNGTSYSSFSPRIAIGEMGSSLGGSATAVTQDGRSYIDTTSELLYIANLKHGELEPYGVYSAFDMMHLSYDIKVPTGDTSTKRDVLLNFLGTSADGGDSHYMQTSLQVDAINGKFSVTSGGNNPFTDGESNTADIKPGKWQKVDIYVYKNAQNTIDVIVAVDGVHIYTGTSTATHMGIFRYRFETDGVTTSYDNIKVALDSSANIPESKVEEKVVVETTFDGLENGTVYNGFDPKEAIAEMGSKLTGSGTAVTEGERSYINTTSELLYIANLKHSELVPYGLYTIYDMMHISYDIKVPENDSSTKRDVLLNFLGTSADGGDSHYMQTSLQIDAINGEFVVSSTGSSPFVNGESSKVLVTNDWQKVDIYVYKNAQNTIDVVVTVDGKGIFTGTSTATHMGIFRFRFETDGKATSYDNIKVTLDSSDNIPSYEIVEPEEPDVPVVPEEPEVQDTAIVVTKTTFDTLANGQSYGGGSLYSHATEDGLNKSAFLVTSDGGNITSVHEGDRKYITTAAKRAIYNYNKAQTDFAGYGYGVDGYDALRVSYEINVPADDAATTRDFYIQHNGHTTSAYVRSPLAIHTVNGKFGVSSTSGNYNGYTTYNAYTAEYSATADVKPGQWQKVDVYFYRNDADNAIDVTVTVDDTVIYVGKGVENVKYFGLGVFGIFTDGTSPAGYDNIEVSLDKKANVPTIDYVVLGEISTSALYSGETSQTCGASTNVYNVLPFSGVIGSVNLFHSADSTGATTYSIVSSGNNNYLNVASNNGSTRLVQNIRKSFADYVRGTESKVVYSFDMFIPSGTSSVKRDYTLYFGLGNTHNLGAKFTAVNGFGEFNAMVGTSTDSIKVPVPENEWFTVKFVIDMPVTGGVVTAYGICDNNLIYVKEQGLNVHGTSNIQLNQVEIMVGSGQSVSGVIDTGFDNMIFARNNDFSLSSVDSNRWDNRKVEISKDASGNVDVYAKTSGDGFTSGVMVMAVYDKASGKLVEYIPSTTIVNGAFQGEVPASKLLTGYEVKAFVFDAITTVNPLIPHGTLQY